MVGAVVAFVVLSSAAIAVAGAAIRAADPVCAMACCKDAQQCCCRAGSGHDESDDGTSMPEIASRTAVVQCAQECAAVSTGLSSVASVLVASPVPVDGPCASKPPPADVVSIDLSRRFDRSAPRAPPLLSV